MPYPRAHQYLSISGTLFGIERWSIGLRLNNVAGSFPATQAAQQTLCDAYASAVGTWFAGQNAVGSAARLDLVKLNEITVLGKYARAWTNLKEIVPSVAGGGPAPFPPQIAMVLSLRTGANRGGAARGRIFLPAPTAAMQSNGVMSAATQTGTLATCKGLIDAVNGVDAGRVVVIASKVGTGVERSVTRIELGTVLDTMRSRRTSMPELPVGVALAGAPFSSP